ncbi:MAG: 16S rRNA (cytosine(1402)-N(4))-methyltransferase RsmH [Saccharofermentanales bacterium]
MTSGEYSIYHRPVLFNECMEALAIKPDGVYVDCTTGGGGHSAGILEKLGKGGLLICLDKDDEALAAAREKLSHCTSEGSYRLIKSDFSKLDEILNKENIDGADGILADFGVSSYQLDANKRGFGYMRNGPLDMRMDQRAALTAETVVNTYPQARLEKIISDYGEERYAGRIANAICKSREKAPIDSTTRLAEIIAEAMPGAARREHQHPAKRTFQAIRIEVNHELESIMRLLEIIPAVLKPGGRFAAISFHSLEDRLVKDAFRNYENPCTCPKDFPMCVCGAQPSGFSVTKKPIIAADNETELNPRARSAKLRIFETKRTGGR